MIADKSHSKDSWGIVPDMGIETAKAFKRMQYNDHFLLHF